MPQELKQFTGIVVATGGGAVTRQANWGYMQHGIVIWLDGPPDLLARRANKDGTGKRPLLSSDAGPQTVRTPGPPGVPVPLMWERGEFWGEDSGTETLGKSFASAQNELKLDHDKVCLQYEAVQEHSPM